MSDQQKSSLPRKKLPSGTPEDVIASCRRVCAMCYALQNDATTKHGQLAHLDKNRTNDAPDNLAYLCLAHHDEYDTTRRQTRNFTAAEVKRYRAALLRAIRDGLAPKSYLTSGAALRMTLREAFLETRGQWFDGKPRVHLNLLVLISNSGSVGSCIEDVRLYWRDQVLLDEREGLLFPSKDDTAEGLAADWWRSDAQYMVCTNDQYVEPGKMRKLVASVIFEAPKDFPDLGALAKKKVPYLEITPPLLLEAIPVIGSPLAVQVERLRALAL